MTAIAGAVIMLVGIGVGIALTLFFLTLSRPDVPNDNDEG